MNLDFLKGNPALNDISPEKLQFLMDFASKLPVTIIFKNNLFIWC